MARREERHWWYAGMRRVALAVLASALPDRQDLLLLDAGCGTGGTTVALRRFGRVVGIDLAWPAVSPAQARGLRAVGLASIENMPFASETFDAATSFEVVYHLGVANDRAALREIRRVLKPGGVFLLRVPAHDWLRGEHDRLVHTRHRYAWSELVEKLTAAGFQVDLMSWANSLLFPPAAAKRLLERADRPTGAADDALGEPDLWQPPGPVNAVLEKVVGFEALVIPRRLPLPFGLSLLAVARAA